MGRLCVLCCCALVQTSHNSPGERTRSSWLTAVLGLLPPLPPLLLGHPLNMCWQALGVTQVSEVLFIIILFFFFSCSRECKISVGLFVFAQFSDLEPL